jgi:hypothetical protein
VFSPQHRSPFSWRWPKLEQMQYLHVWDERIHMKTARCVYLGIIVLIKSVVTEWFEKIDIGGDLERKGLGVEL